MAVELGPSRSSLVDVLDRVLDKGIVIDAWMRVSVAGIDLITVEARIVVASVATYLQYSGAFMDVSAVPARAAGGTATIFDGRMALPRRPGARSTARAGPGPSGPVPEL